MLALIDSTSVGTLVLPLWLMLAPGRLRTGRILLFLATVAGFYLVVGLVLHAVAEPLAGSAGEVLATRPVQTALLAAGAGLLVWSFRLEARAKREKARGTPVPGRLLRWRERAVGAGGGRGGAAALAGLALAAATAELATMLPYLAALGLLTTAGLDRSGSAGVLAAYCTVMVLPALLLLLLRRVAARWVDPALRRLDGWLVRNATDTLSWATGIVGVVLVVNTAGTIL